jgi:hypothetical protein
MVETNSKAEETPVSKERLVQMLGDSFAELRKTLEPMRAGVLGMETDFFGTKMTRRTVFIFIDTHIAEHLGQLIAYARANGITPPWSR